MYVDITMYSLYLMCYNAFRGRHVRDRMVVGLTTFCAVSAYHH